MSDKKSDSDFRLLKSNYSPNQNPLIVPDEVPLRRRRVRSTLAARTLVDAETGEITAAAVIHEIQEKDDEHFVKVFAAGVAASFELNRSAARVFQAILHEYELTPMTGGFVDSVYIAWFGEGLSGRDIGMSERTFNRGLRELMEKGFIAPKTPNLFWVNPALFFKGDRVMFVREYRRKSQKVIAAD
jgi:hypothetical protein